MIDEHTVWAHLDALAKPRRSLGRLEEIAVALVLEVSTVKSHLARMLPKLGVRSRLQAVVWAYQNRIVAVPEP